MYTSRYFLHPPSPQPCVNGICIPVCYPCVGVHTSLSICVLTVRFSTPHPCVHVTCIPVCGCTHVPENPCAYRSFLHPPPLRTCYMYSCVWVYARPRVSVCLPFVSPPPTPAYMLHVFLCVGVRTSPSIRVLTVRFSTPHPCVHVTCIPVCGCTYARPRVSVCLPFVSPPPTPAYMLHVRVSLFVTCVYLFMYIFFSLSHRLFPC